jgi:hypothetical protein
MDPIHTPRWIRPKENARSTAKPTLSASGSNAHASAIRTARG